MVRNHLRRNYETSCISFFNPPPILRIEAGQGLLEARRGVLERAVVCCEPYSIPRGGNMGALSSPQTRERSFPRATRKVSSELPSVQGIVRPRSLQPSGGPAALMKPQMWGCCCR